MTPHLESLPWYRDQDLRKRINPDVANRFDKYFADARVTVIAGRV